MPRPSCRPEQADRRHFHNTLQKPYLVSYPLSHRENVMNNPISYDDGDNTVFELFSQTVKDHFVQ